MKKATLFVLFLAAPALAGQGKVAPLSVEPAKVYPVLLEVIAKKWKVEQASKDSLMVSFRSGMSMSSWKGQDGSCVITAVDEAKSLVICNTEKRGDQLSTWGEGGKIQKQVLQLLAKTLNERKLIPDSEVVK